jgi:hypothetical protein
MTPTLKPSLRGQLREAFAAAVILAHCLDREPPPTEADFGAEMLRLGARLTFGQLETAVALATTAKRTGSMDALDALLPSWIALIEEYRDSGPAISPDITIGGRV